MKITWTNCADAMPPDVTDRFIISLVAFPKVYEIASGKGLQNLRRYDWRWAPYTPEVWKELNRCSQE